MAVIVVMILIPQNAFMRTSYPMTCFVIVYCSQQAFPAAPDSMAMLIIMDGVW